MTIHSSFDFLISDILEGTSKYCKVVLKENITSVEEIYVPCVKCRIIKNETLSKNRKRESDLVCIQIKKDTTRNNELELVQKAKILKRLHTYLSHYKIYVEIISDAFWPAKYLYIEDINKRYLLESTDGIILLPDEFIFFDIEKLIQYKK